MTFVAFAHFCLSLSKYGNSWTSLTFSQLQKEEVRALNLRQICSLPVSTEGKGLIHSGKGRNPSLSMHFPLHWITGVPSTVRRSLDQKKASICFSANTSNGDFCLLLFPVQLIYNAEECFVYINVSINPR